MSSLPPEDEFHAAYDIRGVGSTSVLLELHSLQQLLRTDRKLQMPFFSSELSISDGAEARVALRRFVVEEDGAALVEYGMLLMLIALLAIVALQGIGKKVSKSYESANALLP